VGGGRIRRRQSPTHDGADQFVDSETAYEWRTARTPSTTPRPGRLRRPARVRVDAGHVSADDEHIHSPQTRDGRCHHPARDTPHTTRPRPSRPPHRGAGPRARAGVSGDGQGRLQEEPDLFADAVARAAAKGRPARLDAVRVGGALRRGACRPCTSVPSTSATAAGSPTTSCARSSRRGCNAFAPSDAYPAESSPPIRS
jgi:hypothetical protein